MPQGRLSCILYTLCAEQTNTAFKIRCCFEIKLAGNLKYLSLLDLLKVKLQSTRLFINGFIYIFILNNETNGISLNFPRFLRRKSLKNA